MLTHKLDEISDDLNSINRQMILFQEDSVVAHKVQQVNTLLQHILFNKEWSFSPLRSPHLIPSDVI